MNNREPSPLSRREREIMDIVYRLTRATVADVIDQMSDPPSNSAVRTLLTILEEKGQLKHAQDGARYVYVPTVPREKARKSALTSLVHTFFEGSTRQAIAALIEMPETKLSPGELDTLASLIDKARKEGR
jgi:BlaI family transcriptional regulator, penicillinase repressor